MIFCKELDKEFETKELMFKELIGNLDTIIDFKKSSVQKSCDKGGGVTCFSLTSLKLDEADKAALELDNDYYYIVTNSTRVLDSHEDLHVDGLWDKSVQEQQGKNYLVADHDLSISSVIVKKEYIEMFVTKLPFSALGKPYEGKTQVLIYKFRKDKVIHEVARKWLESGDPIEASVRMRYVQILFAMDSNDPEFKEWKGNYDKYLPSIANKSDFDYIPYYYIIKEAANIRESSLVVFGSNSSTGAITRVKEIEPDDTTHDENKEKIEPTEVIQKLKSSLLLT